MNRTLGTIIMISIAILAFYLTFVIMNETKKLRYEKGIILAITFCLPLSAILISTYFSICLLVLRLM